MEAIIPDLTPIKVIIVFLIRNAKSAKPDQYINTIKLDRCGPSIHRQKKQKNMHDCLSCGSQHRGGLWYFHYLPYDTWLITGEGWGRWNLQVAQLSTYHAWPSSYDVKTQRAALTKKDNGHAFSLAFLQTDRRDTREQEMAGSYSTYTAIQY